VQGLRSMAGRRGSIDLTAMPAIGGITAPSVSAWGYSSTDVALDGVNVCVLSERQQRRIGAAAELWGAIATTSIGRTRPLEIRSDREHVLNPYAHNVDNTSM